MSEGQCRTNAIRIIIIARTTHVHIIKVRAFTVAVACLSMITVTVVAVRIFEWLPRCSNRARVIVTGMRTVFNERNIGSSVEERATDISHALVLCEWHVRVTQGFPRLYTRRDRRMAFERAMSHSISNDEICHSSQQFPWLLLAYSSHHHHHS